VNQVDLEEVFPRLPLLRDFVPADFKITPLTGYTNHNFRLQNHRDDWVLRIPKPETDCFIDRAAEAHNQSLACGLGIAPSVSWRDGSGITLTPTLNSSRALRALDFDDDDMLQAILAPVQRLHRSGFTFLGRVDLKEALWRHFAILKRTDQERLKPRLQQAERVLSLLETRDSPYVASHNDLVLENLLLDDANIWLIDWEYSAMASPYWDLATICNAADLGLNLSRRLLRFYSNGGEPMQESILFDYRGLLKLLADCWMAALVESRGPGC
jgi:thiamine kinase-like enzyme